MQIWAAVRPWQRARLRAAHNAGPASANANVKPAISVCRTDAGADANAVWAGGGGGREVTRVLLPHFPCPSIAVATDGWQDEPEEAFSAGVPRLLPPQPPWPSQTPLHGSSLEPTAPRRNRDKAPVAARALLAAPGARPRPKREFFLRFL